MKRWFLRVSVLVCLVGLGLIAIAQAQRGTQPLPTEETPASMARTAVEPTVFPGEKELPRTLPQAPAKPLVPEPLAGTREPTSGMPGTSIALASAEGNLGNDIRPRHLTRPADIQPDSETESLRPSPASNASVAMDPFARPNPIRPPVRNNSEIGPASETLSSPIRRVSNEEFPPLVEPGSVARPAPSLVQTAGSDPIPDARPSSSDPASAGLTRSASEGIPRPLPDGRPTRDSMAAGGLRPLQESSRAGEAADQALASPYNRSSARPRGEPAPLSIDPTSAPSRLAPGKSSRPEIAPPSSAHEPAAAEGTGQPGKKQLEGPQSPQLTIQKFAPDSIQVGKPATFRVTVVNSGQAVAHGVEIRDLVPRGTQLLNTKPRASRGAGGELVWELGTLKPSDEISVEVQVMPVAEGEIGSVATVRFNADASARSVATKPELTLRASAPNKVLIGDDLVLSIEVSNSGTGVANGVMLSERVPAGLQHPAGNELEYRIGNLAPGDTRTLQLAMTAVRAGAITNVLVASGEGNLKAEHRLEVNVIAPQLDVNMDGPKRRYLEREATYIVSVSNPGTAPAKQVELIAQLPRGLKFVSANGAGHYEATTQTVHWLLEELPANDSGKVELVTLPIEAGEQRLRLQGRAEKGLEVEKEQSVLIEGIAAIMFTVVDVDDPIERGGETVYEIRVVNQGSKASSNVRVVATLPPGLRAVAAEGPSRYTLEANRVTFESLARLAPKADTTYRVRVQGLQPGDQRIRVQLLTDEMQEPVTKEESTRVYSDE